MPTTLALDDDLLDQAKQLSGITDTATLVREALAQTPTRQRPREVRSDTYLAETSIWIDHLGKSTLPAFRSARSTPCSRPLLIRSKTSQA